MLWVGDQPMNETKKPAWPLLKSGQVDLFKPVVFGNDQRMRDVVRDADVRLASSSAPSRAWARRS